MAENEEKLEAISEPKAGKSKLLVIGLPLYIVQLVLVYFITANVLLGKMQPASGNAKEEGKETAKTEKTEIGKFIYSIQDVTVNPALTDGKRYIQVSVGFDLGSEEQKNSFKEKEDLIKDVLNSTFSSKTLDQLTSPSFKDTLKVEISGRVKKVLSNVTINSVYFSKYIIQ
ncbi:MAG: flagellar basal body-associated FliL family protein [Bacteroidota bacterium]|nr:flagellar basal body-associated FliL family protein [Bacteroidota bacterium]